jgi:hypothetical protein
MMSESLGCCDENPVDLKACSSFRKKSSKQISFVEFANYKNRSMMENTVLPWLAIAILVIKTLRTQAHVVRL